MRQAKIVILTLLLTLAVAWAGAESVKTQSKTHSVLKTQPFGKLADGQEISLYTLSNKKGMEVSIITYGGAVQALKVPDKKGTVADVVLGYDDLEGYVNDKAYFGALIGRYGNRIARGKFVLDGITYNVPINDGPNSLHGGKVGFNKRVWTAKDVSGSAGQALELTYLSKDGEEGYPGDLSVKVIYTLPAETNELKIDYSAITDKDTVTNLTNHSYFNLAGQGNGDILGNQLTLRADRFTPVDSTLIPTGELRSVKGTPFDFTHSTQVGARINADDEQLKFGRGYDHNWVLNNGAKGTLEMAAEVYEPASGRVLEVLTTQPGIQFYTGNFLDGTVRGKGGIMYRRRSALCLETQHFPDSPNHPDFPSTELKPGQHLHTTTIYRFSVR